MIDKKLLDKIVDEYLSLKIGDKYVTTPYFINFTRKKDLRVMVGKGTSEEIEIEFKIWSKIKGFDPYSNTEKEIKSFMSTIGLGIDCSGFVVHVLNSYLRIFKKKSVWAHFKLPEKSSLLLKIGYLLRPAEKLGADIITNSDNCIQINLDEVEELDLIRSKSKKQNADHIMLVTDVVRSDNGSVKTIKYAHSTPYYDEFNGVKFGEIEIVDINKPLELQNWLERDSIGICHTLEGYKINLKDNGLRRLVFKKEFEKVQ